MKDFYKKLLEISVVSEYHGTNPEAVVTLKPTLEWSHIFSKLHIQSKVIPNGLLILATDQAIAGLQRMSKEIPAITFEVISKSSGFKNLIDVSQHTNKATLYYTSAEESEVFRQPELLPIRKSLGYLYDQYPTVQVLDEHGVDILSQTTLRPGDRELPLFLAEVPDGKYTIRGKGCYLAKQGLMPRHFAILSMPLVEVLNQSEFSRKELFVPSRAVYLKYWVNSSHHDLELLSVNDEQKKVTFEAKGKGTYGMLFQSKSRLKLHQDSPHKFQLVNGKKRPLVDQLPLGNATQMKPMEQQPDEYFNEVFINV